MNVVSIVGARPQFVKAFPVSGVLRADHDETLVHTGQHYDDELSGVFFAELPIPTPDVNLGVGSGSHAEQTAAMMTGIEDVLDERDPDVVLVYGDTNSTLAGALVASKRDPLVVHVEAGLRSDNRAMPEEVNRVLTDHCADLLLCPSARAVERVESERVGGAVRDTGDVMYDALRSVRDRAIERSDVLDRLGYNEGEYVLTTVHRAANTDDRSRLRAILDGLADSPLPVVFPAHPRTVDALRRYGWWDEARSSLDVIDPVGYLDFVRLVDGADRVATDSGGVQKEAFYLDVPCVTLRDETEWVETVECGANRLVGADADAVRAALERPFEMSGDANPYGDGDAAGEIVAAIEDALAARTGD